ncbi:hypothetical protein ACOI22_03490 [Glaciecola sp. 2405UD65-10]
MSKPYGNRRTDYRLLAWLKNVGISKQELLVAAGIASLISFSLLLV